MSSDLDMYTGTLKYGDIDFSFAFDKNELRLIPPEDKRDVIEMEWKLVSIGNGTYTTADPISVEEEYIIGTCNETKRRIIFLPKRGSYLSFCNSVVIIKLEAYIVCHYDESVIDRISLSCPEINYIHPVNSGFSYSFPPDGFDKEGVVSITTEDFSTTTTEKQSFFVDKKEVRAYFGISRTVSTKIQKPPLSLESTLMFEFKATEDYSFILKLWRIAKDFLSFLCYRKNVYIPTVKLATPFREGKHKHFATMYLLTQDENAEPEVLENGRYIKQAYIAGHEGKILADIASNNIYLRHLPETYRSGRHIDAARFVMITAAFEWEFKRIHPAGIKKSQKTIEAENEVLKEIQKHIEASTGKKKKIYKFLFKLVQTDSLQEEVIRIGKDFNNIIDILGNRLYSRNGQQLKYSEMGLRLSNQRNHFAHGDLDKDFIGLSLLDLVYLEYVIYAMQLKHYELDDVNIQKSINDLFKCGFMIKEKK